MARRKGRLPGRFVNGHLRGRPHRRGEYVKVGDYQERIESPRSKLTLITLQGELDLSPPPAVDDDSSPTTGD